LKAKSDIDGSIHKVRFICVDAPELAQKPWGHIALKRLMFDTLIIKFLLQVYNSICFKGQLFQ
jgi:hypothetical protein